MGPPCASCKLLRRRCTKDCVFAPYFPSDHPHKFAIVHKVFGASNVCKMLQELPMPQRGDAVKSLVYEAEARVRDPVYGCVGAISYLQNQVCQLQMQLALVQAEILCFQFQMRQQRQPPPPPPPPLAAAVTPQSPLQFVDDDNSSSFFLLQSSSTDNNNNTSLIYDSFKKDSLYAHDIVS